MQSKNTVGGAGTAGPCLALTAVLALRVMSTRNTRVAFQKHKSIRVRCIRGKKKSGKVTQQERWMEAVHSLMDVNSTFSAEAKSVAERLSEYDNCPRKKKKFTNFLKNSFRVREAVIEEIFVALEKAVEMKRVADEGASEAKKRLMHFHPRARTTMRSKSRSNSSSSSSSSSNDNNNTEQPDAKRGDKWWREKVRAALRAEPERK